MNNNIPKKTINCLRKIIRLARTNSNLNRDISKTPVLFTWVLNNQVEFYTIGTNPSKSIIPTTRSVSKYSKPSSDDQKMLDSILKNLHKFVVY